MMVTRAGGDCATMGTDRIRARTPMAVGIVCSAGLISAECSAAHG